MSIIYISGLMRACIVDEKVIQFHCVKHDNEKDIVVNRFRGCNA